MEQNETTQERPIFEDSEIPDLVLETILGFVAEVTPIESWWKICVVSKRWNRISKPVFKEALKNAWPKFVLPRKTGARRVGNTGKQLSATLQFNEDRDVVSEPSAPEPRITYRWAFTRPVSLHELRASGSPSIGVVFIPDESGFVQIGAWLVHSGRSNFFDKETAYDAYSSPERFDCDGPVCCVTLGAYGGYLIVQTLARERIETRTPSFSTRLNEPYEVSFTVATGEVSFTVNGKPHTTATLDVAAMLEHKDSVLVFGVGMDAERHVRLRSRAQPH